MSPGTTLHVTAEGFEVTDASGRHLAYHKL
jgi:hypothetical protein